MSWNQPSALFRITGSLLYIAGSVVVTMLFNVPLNNALAKADPTSTESEAFWTDYLRTWTAWNHVRTVSSLLAAAANTFALGQL